MTWNVLAHIPSRDKKKFAARLKQICLQLDNQAAPHLTDGTKMVAMTENDTVPSVENLIEEKSGWLYFCPWYGEHLMSSAFNYQDYAITTPLTGNKHKISGAIGLALEVQM